ncbi:MAG: ABC transporter permease [Candidatus Kariarchaeaceae archaeon]|jgi:ABC-type antimicrobial peptide transport system permease subunit
MIKLKFLFSLKYALKSINRRKKKNLASVFAVTLGVMLLTGVNTGLNGLEYALADSWWKSCSETDIIVSDWKNYYFPENLTGYLENSTYMPLWTELKTVAPMIVYYYMAIYAEGQYDKGTNIFGINPEIEGFDDFYDLNSSILDIKTLLVETNRTTRSPAIISEYMAESMDLQLNSTLQTVIPNGGGGLSFLLLEVVGIYSQEKGRGTEEAFRPNLQLYTNLENLQKNLVPEKQDYITQIRLQFRTVDEGGVLSRNLEDLDIDNRNFPGKDMLEEAVLKVGYQLDNLQRFISRSVWSPRIYAADTIKDEVEDARSTLNIFVFLLSLTALLLVVNVQAMSIEDRRTQTAILRAIGASRAVIFGVFFIESFLVGIVGSIFGILAGFRYGYFIQNQINNLHANMRSNTPILFTEDIITAMLFGILLSTLTILIPALHSATMKISHELRGITVLKHKRESRLSLGLGSILLLPGSTFLSDIGKFWKKSAWRSLADQIDVIIALALTIAGISLLLSLFIKRKHALNLCALSYWGLSIFTLFEAIDWVTEDDDGPNWFTINLLLLVIGSCLFLIVNFDSIMNLINRIFLKSKRTRAISQVTVTELINKKGRATMIVIILTIILVTNIFLVTCAHTMRTERVAQYEWRTDGMDIVVRADVPSDNITQVIGEIDGVENVFSFRMRSIPIYWGHPRAQGTSVWIMQAIELKEAVINPNGNWDNDSFVISFSDINEEDGYEVRKDMTPDEHRDLSTDVFDDFFDNKTRMGHNQWGADENQTMIIGGPWSNSGDRGYFSGYWQVDGFAIHPIYRVGASFNWMGYWDLFGGTLLINEKLAAKLPEFGNTQEPNLFLVRTNNTYHERSKNRGIAQEIEQKLNDLDDPDSLSSKIGGLVGATTELIEENISDYWEEEARTWDFLSTFAVIGLIIGTVGMVVITSRSVGERQREIGMMRAIGFSRGSVLISVITEMMILSIIGLIFGIINGVIMVEAINTKLWDVKARYPMNILGMYTLIILGISLFATIIPGIKASRVKPSQALRYTG